VNDPIPTLRGEGDLIRVSGAVKRRLADLQAERRRELGRAVTYSEVIEQLLADQWDPKPHDEGTSYCTTLPPHRPGQMGCQP
jgi:hypothetical protein